jgi:hypothetical protein
MIQKPLKIHEKIQKKIFFAIYPGTHYPFLGLKKFSKFFWLQIVPGTAIQKKFLKNVGSTWY